MTLTTTTEPKAIATATREQRQEAIANLSLNGKQLTTAQVEVIKTTIAKGASPEELRLFIAVCGRTGLDPFTKQIHFVKRGGIGAIQVGIDGYRLIAERSGKYAGQDPPEWCGEDGLWKSVWLSDAPPAAARVSVYHEDFSRPVVGVVRWKSFNQPDSPTWKKLGPEMLAKCAEAQALRRAFPNELSDLFVEGVETDPGPRDDRRHGNGPTRELPEAVSSARVLEDAMSGGEDSDDPGSGAPESEEPAADSSPPVSLTEFLGVCKKAKNVLSRTFVKEAPAGSGAFYFVDMVTIDATLRENEIKETLLLQEAGEQVVPQERLERLYLALSQEVAKAATRTA